VVPALTDDNAASAQIAGAELSVIYAMWY